MHKGIGRDVTHRERCIIGVTGVFDGQRGDVSRGIRPGIPSAFDVCSGRTVGVMVEDMMAGGKVGTLV